jgi:peptidoglycan/xylan/chitin deacetylase (PgdA/CDA1 family)/predicted LPLAT superfamily acyltransferase
MRLAWIGAVALVAGVACGTLVPRPEGTWLVAGVLAAFIGLLVRGIASVRSSLVEPTAWRAADPQDRRVALSFDDGPHPVWTPRVLDALRARGVRATFFVVGANVRRFPGLVRRIAAEGHDVGCHTDSHSPRTGFLGRDRMRREITACLDAVRAETGLTPRLYRPPYGVRSPAHTGLAAALDLVVVGMARRGHDKDRGATPAAVTERTLGAVRPGEIVALHDGDERGREDAPCPAADALPAVLDGLAARGLAAAPVSAILSERPYRESPRRSWTGRTHGGRSGNWIFAQLVRFGGAGAGLVLLVFVSAWFVLAKGDARRASVGLRRRLFGRAALPTEAWWAYRHFFVYGRTLVWRLAATRGGAPAPEVEFVGYESIRTCVETPGPILLVSAHLGDWSGASRRLHAENGRSVSIVAYRGVGLGPHQVQGRASGADYRLIDVESGSADVALAIASALAAGGAVAMHADRTMDDDRGVRVPFLGGEATFPTGVWKLAMVTGAPAVVYFAIPLSPHRVLVRTYAPIRVPRVPREGRDAAVREAAATFAACLEDAVRRDPLHWGNFHDLWGTA